MRYALLITAGLAAILLYLLSTASADPELSGRHYQLLLGLNAALLGVLAGIVVWQLAVLWRKLRARVFGSRLTLRFVLLFGLMALGPGVLVYAVSVQFIAKSIESWFDIRVDKALEGGLALGRAALDNNLRDLTAKADAMALVLAEVAPGAELATLERLREQAGVAEATLFGQRGSVIAMAGPDAGSLLPELPSASVLRQIRMQQKYGAISSMPNRGLFLRAVVPVNVLSMSEDIRVLQLLQPVPQQLARDAEAVQALYEDYQKLILSRKSLRRLFAVTLTLALLMAVFAAFGLAFVISDRLSTPLANLAEGTRAVAGGDFSRRHPVSSSDELGVLTESFNAMTGQLAEARGAAERHQQAVEGARAYLESILANLSSGVLALDGQYWVRSMNTAAEEILGARLANLAASPLPEWGGCDPSLETFGTLVTAALGASRGDWERQIERERGGVRQVLLVRGSRLPEVTGGGYVVVFDDISGLLEAQRAAAWGEVARRMAHEVKNPLTPIRLSAERLRLKLSDHIAPREAEVLERATQTIITQVDAMKSMVDAFSQYARAPETRLAALDVNQVVREVLALYEAHRVHIHQELAPVLPLVRGDQVKLRQVIHNLVQNAEDAVESADGPAIVVRTEAAAGGVRLRVRDNGCGFPEHILARAFEPYVTTKPRGTGLGLAIVRKIVEEHQGMIEIEKAEPRGTCVSVTLPAAQAV
jgi:nitrogen fixation/metabolism regulation signal transduction histidine kinase